MVQQAMIYWIPPLIFIFSLSLVFGIVRYLKKTPAKTFPPLEKWTSPFPRVRSQWMVFKTSQMLLLTTDV
jgi:hypothetical protein